MAISAYHQKYASLPNSEIVSRATEKQTELSLIFQTIPLKTSASIVRIAVLGCGDKRFIPLHKQIFENLLHKPIEMLTMDIEIDHLAGEEEVPNEDITEHDCTTPLPDGPFDIVYSHVLLKFIETAKQWDVIKNSWDALTPNGIAIHVLNKEDYEGNIVPLKQWEEELDKLNIKFLEVPVKFGLALVTSK